MQKQHEVYHTQVLEVRTTEGVPIRHLKISRRDGKPIRATWDVLQEIKNHAVGENVTMVEVFPAEQELVNEVNYRHLWEVPELTFGLHLTRR